MKIHIVFGLLVTLTVHDLAWTYPYGAPDSACSTLMPGHRLNRNETGPLLEPVIWQMPYYSIHVERSYDISAGEIIEVTLKADEHDFRGFLLHAMDSWEPLTRGEFFTFTPDTKVACWGEAVTHSRPLMSTEVSFYWTAPSVSEYTCVRFVATVVRNYTTFFMDVTSDEVCIDPVTGAAATHVVTPLAAAMMLCVAMVTSLLARL